MKTTKIKVMGYRLWVIGIFLLLAGTAWAVDYKNSYRQPAVSGMQSAGGYQPSAAAPSAMFRSTSAYSGQWSEQGPRLVNEDGSVNHEAYMSGSVGPRKNSANPGTPGDDDEEEGEQQPLGDTPWLWMMALVGLYALYATKKRKRLFRVASF